MAASSEDLPSSTLSLGLNNMIARETSPHSPKVSGKQSVENVNQSIRGSPSEKPRYQLWPAVKKAMSPSARHTPDLGASSTMNQVSPNLRERSPQASIDSTMRTKYKEGLLPRRRKVSVPELGLGLMATVQEGGHMDSPTIPGRFPVHERSNSAPGTSLRKNPFEESMLSPVAEPESLSDARTGSPMKPSPLREERKSLKRASSALLPEEVSSLILPMSTYNPHARAASPRGEKSDQPPAVPPKSPRTILRIPPLAPAINTSHSQSSSNAQTPAPISAPEIGISPSPFTPPWQSPVRREESPKPALSSKSPSHKQGSSLPSNTAFTDFSSLPRIDSISPQHRREASETSVLERGRSSRRAEGVVKKRRDDPSFATLPPGVSATDASSMLPRAEVEQLQQQAIGQAERFQVLKYDDVKKLSRELRLLDERCDYLRKTHNELRSGRRNLHARMITYLKSPRLSKFSRESMLKQEEALAELDLSIDEWVAKLEQAENRRTRVRQKLLEHVAAALMMQTNRSGSSPPQKAEQTPPTSPEKPESPHNIERETVHIYADEQLLACLLQDIEKEIEQMVEPKSTD